MHDDAIVEAFTRQAEGFNRSAVANATDLLALILAAAGPAPDERWLELACGPGIVSRALAPSVAAIHGVDATPAMVELARREAADHGIANATFSVGDATALDVPDGSLDGVVGRFCLHHIPVPARVFAESRRVVRAGGRVVLVDQLADADLGAHTWAQELERVRDPSHWASLPIERLRALGREVGLRRDSERVVPMTLDFDDWLARGSAGAANAGLVERLLAERPSGTECFRIERGPSGRSLSLRVWIGAWRSG